MDERYRWERCDDELGVALWRTLRPMLGSACSVGESYTSDEHVITSVWSMAPEVPILKCESWYKMKPSPDLEERSYGMRVRGDGVHAYYLPVAVGVTDGELRGDVEDIAAALDAAELRGHTRAVQETAIASIHKAVAVERAAVVEWLRLDSEESTNDTVAYTAARLADEIERGDHHFPKEQA